MPVTTRNLADRHADDQRYQDLKRRLVAEWNDQQSDPPRPDILQETDRNGNVVHVYVTWDEWADLDAQTRSELIVDALQKAKGDAAVLELTLAMGLTPEESARLNVAVR